jgi:hypothetical protein
MVRDVLIDATRIESLTIQLRGFEEQVGEATYHALNRTIDQVVTHVGRIIPKEYAIKAKEVKDSFVGGITRPTRSNLEASLTSRSRLLSFAHFPYTPKFAKRGKGSSVKVQIKKSGGKVKSKSGFVATTGATSEDAIQFNVFHRFGPKVTMTKGSHEGEMRQMIAPIRTLSIPQMIINEDLGEKIQEFATNKLNERLQHEIERAMLSVGDRLR